MKKYFSALVLAAATFGAAPAMAIGNNAGSTVDLTGAPATRPGAGVNYQTYETRSTTRTYSNSNVAPQTYTTQQQVYARQPQGRVYRNTAATTNTATTTRSGVTRRTETVRTAVKRKYYLAHPFFQPTEGKFGSITDLSYNTASYDIEFTPAGTMTDTSAKWDMKQFAIKEDFSFGITDRIGILAMARFDSSKYKFDWKTAPDDTMDKSDLNLYGLGVQWRFVDNAKWIATLSAIYERQKDVANEGLLDLKAGYKVSKSTIYGLARGWYVHFDEENYGNGITGKNELGVEETLFIAYETNVKNRFLAEFGAGVFSVLGEDWTLNLEAIFGYYKWHNQAYVKGAVGWQPNDWFALNLYARTSFYDSAEGKSLDFFGTENGVWDYMGKAKLDKYNETSFGAQVIFYF